MLFRAGFDRDIATLKVQNLSVGQRVFEGIMGGLAVGLPAYAAVRSLRTAATAARASAAAAEAEAVALAAERGAIATAEGLEGAPAFADAAQAELQLELAVARARSLGVRVPANVRFIPDLEGSIAAAQDLGRLPRNVAAVWSEGPGYKLASLETIVPPNGVITVRVAPATFASEADLVAAIAHESAEIRSTLSFLGRSGPVSLGQWKNLVDASSNGIYHMRAMLYQAAALKRLGL